MGNREGEHGRRDSGGEKRCRGSTEANKLVVVELRASEEGRQAGETWELSRGGGREQMRA